MKVRAKIALCTEGGSVPRGGEFVTTKERGAQLIEQGKAVEVTPTRAKSTKVVRRKPAAAPPASAAPAASPEPDAT